jgi:hypothetical protein
MTEDREPGSSASAMLRAVKENPADPIAVTLSGALVIACVFEVPGRLGITAEELGVVIGVLGSMAASWRGWREHRRRRG